MDEKLLTEGGWKAVVAKFKIKDTTGVQKALGLYEHQDEKKYLERIKALGGVITAAGGLKKVKEVVAAKDADKYLTNMIQTANLKIAELNKTMNDAAIANQPMFRVNYGGKSYYFNAKEYDDFKKKVIAELQKTAVSGAKRRIQDARAYWEALNKNNEDQPIVSGIVSLVGTKLPDESIINDGEGAFCMFRDAVAKGDFAKVQALLKPTSEKVDKAYRSVMDYKARVEDGAGGVLPALEFVKNVSFKIAEEIAEAEMDEVPGSGAIVGGGSALIQKLANDLGEYIAK